MKDINQILFRVFNSRKYHDYLTIDDDDDDVALTPLQPPPLPAGRSNGHLPGGSGNSQNTGSTMVDCSSGSSTRTMIDDQDDQVRSILFLAVKWAT